MHILNKSYLHNQLEHILSRPPVCFHGLKACLTTTSVGCTSGVVFSLPLWLDGTNIFNLQIFKMYKNTLLLYFIFFVIYIIYTLRNIVVWWLGEFIQYEVKGHRPPVSNINKFKSSQDGQQLTSRWQMTWLHLPIRFSIWELIL